MEEYTARLALQIFRSAGLEAALRQEANVDEAIDRAGLCADVARTPVHWVLATLASHNWIGARKGADSTRFQLLSALPELDPEETLARQEMHDPRCLPSYQIASLAASQYPAVLRGEITGEQALFGPEGISGWVKYFSNANPLYAINNAIGAIAAARAFPPGRGSILELGGGLGSAAESLLEALQRLGRLSDVSSYRFTEISPLFLKRAERTLARRFECKLAFSALDIDRPFSDWGVAPASCTLVYGVNVLHVAYDLGASLRRIRQALERSGTLVVSECVRPFPGRPLYLELVFNLLESFRDPLLVPAYRPNGGFLTPEQWTAALTANGFTDVEIYPDIPAIRDAYPAFVIAAIIARPG
jgi:SAM-dependent methyltransferase